MKKLLLILFCLPIIAFGHGDIKQVKYIENKGQWEENILFKANIPEGEVFLENHKFTYSFMDYKTLDSLHHIAHDENNEDLFKNETLLSKFSEVLYFKFKIKIMEINNKNIILYI